MINKTLTEMVEMTEKMVSLLEKEQYEDFEKQLDKRQQMIDLLKNYKFQEEEVPFLQKIYSLDQHMIPLIQKNMENTKNQINMIKNQKVVSKKFRPYLKQTSGVFLDKRN